MIGKSVASAAGSILTAGGGAVVKVAGADADAADVAAMDADRIARLKTVFWDMTVISHRIEIIHHPGSSEDDDGWTERNLYITITAKTAEEMKTAYRFNRNQIAALEELLEQRALLLELLEDAYSVSGDTAALLRSLPEDLSPERKSVVRTACLFPGNEFLSVSENIMRIGQKLSLCMEGASATEIVIRGKAAQFRYAVLTQELSVDAPSAPVPLENLAGVSINDYLLALHQLQQQADLFF